MPATPEPPVLLDWDSDFWGVRIARAAPPVLGGQQHALSRWATDHDVACLFLRVRDQDRESLQSARGFGFRIVESRVEYELALGGDHPSVDDVRSAQPADVEKLSAIARASHRDSRFYLDPNFPDDRCGDFFATWIVNSCCHGLADWVFVADVAGQPSGYVTGQKAGVGVGRIGLIAVAERARGRGVGAGLVAAALARFGSDGVGTVRVATQMRNSAANRLYRRAGFTERELSHDLHWWRDGATALRTA